MPAAYCADCSAVATGSPAVIRHVPGSSCHPGPMSPDLAREAAERALQARARAIAACDAVLKMLAPSVPCPKGHGKLTMFEAQGQISPWCESCGYTMPTPEVL